MNLTTWKYDLRSSLVVFLVALPLCLGVSLASSAPLSSGLIAGMIGGIVVGFISNSPLSVSGPAAGLTVIVAGAISDLGSFNAFTLSVFLAGIIQIIFSFARGGNIGNYFPTSVIKGMLAAIGLILILKQLPHFVGYDADFFGDESFNQLDGQNTFTEISRAIQSSHFGSTLIAILAMVVMLQWDKAASRGKMFFQIVPGPLIAVLASVIINQFFQFFIPELTVLDKHLVDLPFKGGVGELFYTLSPPDWTQLNRFEIYKTALILAIVASIESLLSVEAADKIDEEGRSTSKNRELFAQGFGNAISGLVGGLPVTAVIVRTSANAAGGAKSKLSTILHGFWLFLCVVSISPLLNLIPLSCLASILILVGYKLTKPQIIKKMYVRGLNQFIPFIVTITAILFTDLLIGIMIGMIVGFIFVMRSNIHKSIVLVNEGNLYLIRFYKDVSFLQKSIMMKMLHKIPEDSYLVIDGSKSVYVDDDIVELIEDFIKRAQSIRVNVELKKSPLALSAMFKAE